MVVYLIRSVLGPELYRIYKSRQGSSSGKDYQPNDLEYFSNYAISIFRGFYILCKWTSPVILAYVYYRDYFSLDGIHSLTRLVTIVGFIVTSFYITRGIGRWSNPEYQVFLKRFLEMNNAKSDDRKKFLSEYDFDLRKWNADFISSSHPPKYQAKAHSVFHQSIIDTIKFNFFRLASRICVDTFGLRMMYPGAILSGMIGKVLHDGRTKLVEQKRGQRALVQTRDSYANKIDTMFVDARGELKSEYSSRFATLDSLSQVSQIPSKYLVICCDGNASFYEVGLFQSALDNGFSVLGWNYPGFGQSTGQPYPEQLTSAADAVMQYAFSLGFKSDEIILASWSIGGFTISWLANQYPDVRAVILDAAFDDVYHLAQQQMPQFATTFVEYTIRHNLNLNVSELINKYNGPVLFIRRTQDEIISTNPKEPASNRGNDLLISLLNARYPYIVDNDTIPYLRTWLSVKSDTDRARVFAKHASDLATCQSVFARYLSKHVENKEKSYYPIELGKKNTGNTYNNNMELSLSNDCKLTLALYLADKYLANFESSHCIPLPKSYFRMPWSDLDLISSK